MKILLVILLLFLIYIMAKKIIKLSNQTEHFTHLFDFNSLKKDSNMEKITFHLEKHSTDTFNPKYTIQNESGQPYLYINSFWEMHDLNVPITDKDKNIVSTVKHYNSNIYNYNLDNKDNEFHLINNNNTLFNLKSGDQTFIIKGNTRRAKIYHNNQLVGIINRNNGKYIFKIDQDLNDCKNIIGTAFMIYLQLIKEQQHISI